MKQYRTYVQCKGSPEVHGATEWKPVPEDGRFTACCPSCIVEMREKPPEWEVGKTYVPATDGKAAAAYTATFTVHYVHDNGDAFGTATHDSDSWSVARLASQRRFFEEAT
jgi:hypothetical protein